MKTLARTIIASIALSSLGACATKPQGLQIKYDNMDFSPALIEAEPALPVKIVELPELLPLPGQMKPIPTGAAEIDPDARPPEARVSDANEAAKIEASEDGYINAIQKFPYVKGALYQLYTAVNQVSDIALQPGEKLISVSAGDTVRWVVGDTQSGVELNDGNVQIQVHILVKPIASGLRTNLVINTDRRTYHLEMQSTDNTYMASISWTYPHQELAALRAQNANAIGASRSVVDVGLKLEDLQFRYHISGSAPWKPIRVFDDGKKVYIQFPSGLSQGEAPPLFVIASDGEPALVNYRVRNNYYIVDRLFAAAELQLGTEPQQIVRIVRTDAR